MSRLESELAQVFRLLIRFRDVTKGHRFVVADLEPEISRNRLLTGLAHQVKDRRIFFESVSVVTVVIHERERSESFP